MEESYEPQRGRWTLGRRRQHLLQGCSAGRGRVPDVHSSYPPLPFIYLQGSRDTVFPPKQRRTWSEQERLSQGSAPLHPYPAGASPEVSVRELQTPQTWVWPKKEVDLGGEM